MGLGHGAGRKTCSGLCVVNIAGGGRAVGVENYPNVSTRVTERALRKNRAI
jgi:hypothetical protein